MVVESDRAILTAEEELIACYKSPVELSLISEALPELLRTVEKRENIARMTLDADDIFPHSIIGEARSDLSRLQAARETLLTMAGVLIVHGAEEYLRDVII